MISSEDVYKSFFGSFPLNVKIMREYCQIRTVEFLPKHNSQLRLQTQAEETFRIPLDSMIAPAVLLSHAWDTKITRLAAHLANGMRHGAILIDIGANVGLFSRQMLNLCPQFRYAFLYEPHPENFSCLRHNMLPFECAEINNDALGPAAGRLSFYLDPDNSGNYSLNKSAMPTSSECRSVDLSVKSAVDESRRWTQKSLPIFYKSDTQGYDELIATAMDVTFWDNVFAGLIELWCIEKPAWPARKMASILDKYPYKRFAQDLNVGLNTADVMLYLERNDGSSKDLLFWK